MGLDDSIRAQRRERIQAEERAAEAAQQIAAAALEGARRGDAALRTLGAEAVAFLVSNGVHAQRRRKLRWLGSFQRQESCSVPAGWTLYQHGDEALLLTSAGDFLCIWSKYGSSHNKYDVRPVSVGRGNSAVGDWAGGDWAPTITFQWSASESKVVRVVRDHEGALVFYDFEQVLAGYLDQLTAGR